MWLLGRNTRFLTSFLTFSRPGARCRGALSHPIPLGVAEIYPSCSPSQRKKSSCPKRWDHLDTEGREKSFSRALPAANWEMMGQDKPGVHVDASTSRFLKVVRLILLPASHTDTCALLHDTSLDFFATSGVHHHPQAITAQP